MVARSIAPSRAVPSLGIVTLLIGVGSLIVGAAAAVVALGTTLANGTLAPAHLLLVLPLAFWGYGLRFVRWHLLIRRAVPNLGLWPSFRAQAIGFGLSVTPGRVAELWKLYLVERATHAPAAVGAGAMLVERATDLVGFTALAAIAATQVPGSTFQRPGTIAVVAAAALVIAIVARPIVARRLRSSGGPSIIRQFVDGGNAVARPVPVAAALLALMLGRAGDGLLLWGVVAALGHPISPSFAIFAFASAGLVGGLSLLPGGIGAAEGTMVAVLATVGMPTNIGLLAVLITRALILWIWVALGMALFAQEWLVGRKDGGRAP
jgi:uncharacterized membrane protein YbhN (UPF0104 family)